MTSSVTTKNGLEVGDLVTFCSATDNDVSMTSDKQRHLTDKPLRLTINKLGSIKAATSPGRCQICNVIACLATLINGMFACHGGFGFSFCWPTWHVAFSMTTQRCIVVMFISLASDMTGKKRKKFRRKNSYLWNAATLSSQLRRFSWNKQWNYVRLWPSAQLYRWCHSVWNGHPTIATLICYQSLWHSIIWHRLCRVVHKTAVSNNRPSIYSE